MLKIISNIFNKKRYIKRDLEFSIGAFENEDSIKDALSIASRLLQPGVNVSIEKTEEGWKVHSKEGDREYTRNVYSAKVRLGDLCVFEEGRKSPGHRVFVGILVEIRECKHGRVFVSHTGMETNDCSHVLINGSTLNTENVAMKLSYPEP